MNERRAWLGQVPLVERPSLGAGSPIALTDATFSQALSAPMALVEFWSPGCPVCVGFKPTFEEVANASDGKVMMATVNTDENVVNAGTYKIQALPTLVFFANGKEVRRIEGSLDKTGLVGEISRTFGAGGAAATAGGSSAPAAASGTQSVLSGLALLGILGGAVYMAVQAAK